MMNVEWTASLMMNSFHDTELQYYKATRPVTDYEKTFYSHNIFSSLSLWHLYKVCK